ncbi:MAG: carbohydrate ABC transporter permease [Actinomycetaceae bacterium]|nr:carbohydrate ABC transporter permease [Actinomycetaceae bacterium]MDY5272613.1 carbohydrate ABC transporter permease [Arcanobacterium sp.]
MAINALLVLGALIMFFPFFWTLITSLSSGAGLSATPSFIPENPSLDAYRQLLNETDFGRVVMNSLGLAVATALVQLFTSTTAAYAFSRLKFRGQRIVFACYLATMMIPMQVLIVPLFVQMRNLGLMNNPLGVLLPACSSAFGIFLIRQAMNGVPKELDEAATIDGATHIRIFAQIVLPNVRPALATFSVFAFMSSWNNFLWPLIILRDPLFQTLPIALARLQGQYTVEWDVMMAGSVISILPMLAIYIFAQKYVVQGVVTSGIK